MITTEFTDHWDYQRETTYQTEYRVTICDICKETQDEDRKWHEIDLSYRDSFNHFVRKHIDVCDRCVDRSNVYRMLTV